MKLTNWKPKQKDPFTDLFDFDSPHWGLSLIPSLERSIDVGSRSFFPAVDVTEEEKHVKVKVDAPGLNKDDIQLSADGSLLTIRGERKHEEEKKDKRYQRIERSYGYFERQVDVGTPIDESKVQAKYNNGVLEITVPKTEATPAKRITIE